MVSYEEALYSLLLSRTKWYHNVTITTALENFQTVLVYFYAKDCQSCDDLNPTIEALGEIVTDTAMTIVDELSEDEYSEEEYEKQVNEMAPVLITKLDCDDYPDICTEENVKVYPSIHLYFDGVSRSVYQGHRTVMEIVHWLSEMEAQFLQPYERKMHSVVECKCAANIVDGMLLL